MEEEEHKYEKMKASSSGLRCIGRGKKWTYQNKPEKSVAFCI